MVIVSHGTWFDSTTCKVEVVSSGSVGGCSGVVVVVGDGGGVGRQRTAHLHFSMVQMHQEFCKYGVKSI